MIETIAIGGAASPDVFVPTDGTFTTMGGAAGSGPIRVYSYGHPGNLQSRDDRALGHLRDREAEKQKQKDDYAEWLRRDHESLKYKNSTLEEKLEAALHRVAELERLEEPGSAQEIEQIEERVVLPVLREMGKRERIKTIAKFVGSAALKAIFSRILKQTGFDLGWLLSLIP